MMAILTLLTSRSWLVLRLSTGWGGRGRDIVSRRAENSVLNTWTATLYLFLCTDLFDTNFWAFIWHRPHLKSLLCLGRSCFCQLGASCLLLVVISCWLWIVIIGWYLLTPSFVHWLIFSIGCWWCLLLTTSCSQFTRWSDDLADGSLVLSHIEVDQSHLADYAEH